MYNTLIYRSIFYHKHGITIKQTAHTNDKISRYKYANHNLLSRLSRQSLSAEMITTVKVIERDSTVISQQR